MNADHEFSSQRPGVAAFDFDGTLVRRDTLLPFLAKLTSRHELGWALVAQARRYRSDSDAAKLDVLRRLTTGLSRNDAEQLGRDYAVGLHHLLRPDVMARLRWHRSAGHALVIVSASLGLYLRPFGRTLGFDEVIAVELNVDDAGRYTGEIPGNVNVRGPEKARRLNLWLNDHYGHGPRPEIWAYGDTSGDTELLAMADHPTWIDKKNGLPVSQEAVS